MKHLLATSLLLAACAAPQPPAPRPEPTPVGQRALAVLLGHMVGTWESRPGTTPIRLRIAEFWKGKPNERWVYLEWVAPEEERKPLRQRIWRISEGGGRIVAETFLPPGRDPLAYAGEWRNPTPFASARPSQLRALPGCDLLLENQHEFVFGVGTMGKGCRSEGAGAATERSEFQFTSSEARNLEQAFDAAGKPLPSPTYTLLRTSREPR